MNSLSKTLREIEANVLSDHPEKDTVFASASFSEAEYELHRTAQMIQDKLRTKISMTYLNDDKIPLTERNAKAQEVLNQLSPDENLILDKSLKFMDMRHFRMYKERFELLFPQMHKPQVSYRLAWFEREISRLLDYYLLEDAHWASRDESKILTLADDEAFWNELDVKVKEVYPDGIFTEKSWDEFEQNFIEPLELKVFRQYLKDHPEKMPKTTEEPETEVESLKQPAVPVEPFRAITDDREAKRNV